MRVGLPVLQNKNEKQAIRAVSGNNNASINIQSFYQI